MININKPYLPDINKYIDKIKTIWDTNHLTNYGPLHKELEAKLCKYLDVKDLCLVNSCSNGLLMCLNEFDPDCEIITTPFSFIATTSSIVSVY
jgi:dTDP-4-amino-4,6-dideoxygalactose transaminase